MIVRLTTMIALFASVSLVSCSDESVEFTEAESHRSGNGSGPSADQVAKGDGSGGETSDSPTKKDQQRKAGKADADKKVDVVVGGDGSSEKADDKTSDDSLGADADADGKSSGDQEAMSEEDADGKDQEDGATLDEHGSKKTEVGPKERLACADHFNSSVKSVVLAGNKEHLKLTPKSVLAIKVAGNQSALDLNLKNNGDKPFRGVCLFLTGNLPKANITVTGKVGQVHIRGRGNKGAADIKVEKGAELGGISADLAGNQFSIKAHGKGSYPCPDVNDRSGRSQVSCQE